MSQLRGPPPCFAQGGYKLTNLTKKTKTIQKQKYSMDDKISLRSKKILMEM